MHPLAIRQGCPEHYRLCFTLPSGPGERGVANLVPQGGTRTCGVLYLLTPSDSDRLDRTEGVNRGVYRRTLVEVRADEGGWIQAFTCQSSLHQPHRKPSARYLGLLVAGARQHRSCGTRPAQCRLAQLASQLGRSRESLVIISGVTFSRSLCAVLRQPAGRCGIYCHDGFSQGHGSLPTVFLAGEHSRAAQCACANGDARFCTEESCVREALTASFTCCEKTQLVLYGLSTERFDKLLRGGIGP